VNKVDHFIYLFASDHEGP